MRRIALNIHVKDKTCGVYLIVSPSGRRYVGSSVNIHNRLCDHRRATNGANAILKRSVKKYGFDSHTLKVLFECSPVERLTWERIFGDIYLSLSDFGGMNNNLPAYDEVPKSVSLETKSRQSLAKTTLSKDERRIRKNLKAKELKKKYRAEKISKYGKYIPFISEEQREVMKVKAAAYHGSAQAREKNRIRANERYKNQENRDQVSNGLKKFFANAPDSVKEEMKKRAVARFCNRDTHPRSKKVINIETNEVFNCAKTLAEQVGMSPGQIRSRLNGKTVNNTPYRFLSENLKQAI